MGSCSARNQANAQTQLCVTGKVSVKTNQAIAHSLLQFLMAIGMKALSCLNPNQHPELHRMTDTWNCHHKHYKVHQTHEKLLENYFLFPSQDFSVCSFSISTSKPFHFSAAEADTKHPLRSQVAVTHGRSDHHEELVACFPHSPGTITTKQQFGAHHHWLLLQPTVKWQSLQVAAMKVDWYSRI